MHRGLIIIAMLFCLPSFATDYIVKYKKGTIMSLSNVPGIQVLDQHNKAQLVKIQLNKKDAYNVLPQLYKNPQIEYIVEDFKLKAFKSPISKQGLREQWALAKVNAERAWSLAGNKGSKDIIVAVIDTGVDSNHESLSSNMLPGYDFKDNDNDPHDDTSSKNPGHGTHCAGIVGANGLVEGGISGLAPNISIMPIRFLGADGSGDLMAGIKAIDYAIENGAHVISASWGAAVPRSQAEALIEAVKRASDAGVIFVAAAANDGKNNDKRDVFPANAEFENTISVAASGSGDEKPSWSNYGKATVHLAAPGLNIMSTLPGNKYKNLSGTSMATPLVSGLVALLKSQDPSLTGQQIRALLQTTGAKVSIETACNCRVDAAASVAAVLNKSMFIAPAAMYIKPNESKSFKAINAAGNVTYASSDPSIATVDADGNLSAIAEGVVQLTATDAAGNKATTLDLNISNSRGGGGGGGGNGDCPFADENMCKIACQFQPDLPWCN